MAWVSADEPLLQQNIRSDRTVSLSETRFATYTLDTWEGGRKRQSEGEKREEGGNDKGREGGSKKKGSKEMRREEIRK